MTRTVKRGQVVSEPLYLLPGMKGYEGWVPIRFTQSAPAKPGVYTLGLKLRPNELIVPVYIGASRMLSRRFPEHVESPGRTPSEDDYPITRAFRVIDSEFWCVTWSQCVSEEVAFRLEGMLIKLYDLQDHRLLNDKHIEEGTQKAREACDWWTLQYQLARQENSTHHKLMKQWWMLNEGFSAYRTLPVPVLDLDRQRATGQASTQRLCPD